MERMLERDREKERGRRGHAGADCKFIARKMSRRSAFDLEISPVSLPKVSGHS
jgi:hypothetical protein